MLRVATYTRTSTDADHQPASLAGRMMVQLLGVCVDFERATIMDRVIAGMERKAARGWLARRDPARRLHHTPGRGPTRRQPGRSATDPGDLRPVCHQHLGGSAIAGRLTGDGHRTRVGSP
jgi:site-specific DNA recombinase